ncbi:hypothetical protein TTHERM_000894531 (macronuclear) [Tetrahymena thermophila SB210]|uniref:Uncharacterized protein n=1 Tax=Tetrahymena thermophila (strain SB210) TaxID=312017 RepID=W7XGQ5_TETTS|nr:hypothetical protein TTHERM_000894531 [Tetrahymena thermophila SB210]EWS73371.1 hypothetical protein TTHERM_000894531 [Tetrahymena thermophila SB210]|eukprot:XP_012654104.1 hypothetical protein TTHERM_000894531 [Tetrahymena thermophila SB210]
MEFNTNRIKNEQQVNIIHLLYEQISQENSSHIMLMVIHSYKRSVLIQLFILLIYKYQILKLIRKESQRREYKNMLAFL